MQMHDVLVCIRPGRDAPLEQWQVYYHRSALLYAEIAEIDRSQSEKERASHDRSRRVMDSRIVRSGGLRAC
jgi:hypothetical protein